ncbi:amidohydrolase family protein [bacterium]|nr:amidohydrolase family protein [bacterium]
MRRLLMIAAALAASLALIPAAQSQTILIKDGKVVTNSSAGVIEGGDVLIVDGRIAAVGADVRASRQAKVIDAGGRWVTPGIFAALSETGMSEISGSGAPNDATIGSGPISAAADAARAFDPAATAVAITRIEGVTRTGLDPNATATMFGGTGALVVLDGRADSVFQRKSFMKVSLGEAGARRSGGSRAASWPAFEAALQDARDYPQRYRSGQGGTVLSELDAAAVKPFAEGRGMFLVNIDRAADIRELLRVARADPRLKFAIHGGAEAWRAAPELAAAGIPVIVDPLANLPDQMERVGARLDNAALLQAAGVTIAIAPAPGTDDAQQARLALQLAGNALANGLSWDAALAAITSGPAEIFGVGRDLGRLQPGFLGDVVIWDGDPLEVMSAPTMVLVEGVETSLTTRQTRLRDRYLPRVQD